MSQKAPSSFPSFSKFSHFSHFSFIFLSFSSFSSLSSFPSFSSVSFWLKTERVFFIPRKWMSPIDRAPLGNVRWKDVVSLAKHFCDDIFSGRIKISGISAMRILEIARDAIGGCLLSSFERLHWVEGKEVMVSTRCKRHSSLGINLVLSVNSYCQGSCRIPNTIPETEWLEGFVMDFRKSAKVTQRARPPDKDVFLVENDNKGTGELEGGEKYGNHSRTPSTARTKCFFTGPPGWNCWRPRTKEFVLF